MRDSGTRSTTATTTATTTDTSNTHDSGTTSPVLHLRNGGEKKSNKNKNKVRWTEDVVDNENMNKKKTKICCIFHPHREFGELSSEESSSSSDESDKSDDEGDNSNERPNRSSSPNAYEKQPTYKNK